MILLEIFENAVGQQTDNMATLVYVGVNGEVANHRASWLEPELGVSSKAKLS